MNKRKLWITILTLAGLVLTMALIQSGIALAEDTDVPVTSGKLTLFDEVGNPLANYPADYPSETRNLKYKYRCGGSWVPTTSFQTDASGQVAYSIGCANWDNKITIILNQTSKEQDVTTNSDFQAAKVNAKLKSCTGLITDVPGASVDQGGGYWYDHGSTGSTGTVTFYTFPSNIKLRMNYNHNSQTVYPTIVAGINEVDFQTTKLTINYVGDVKSNKSSSWWTFSKPSMNLLPDDYPFYFKTGSTWDGPVTISVSGCASIYPPSTNQDPVLTVDQSSITVDEGQTATNVGSVSDPDGDPVTLNASIGTVTNNGDGKWSWSFPTIDGPAESQKVTISGEDSNGGTSDTAFSLSVNNVAPYVDNITIPSAPVDINSQPINAIATFSDPAGTYDEPFTCEVNYGDEAGARAGTISGTTCTGPDQTYAEPGVYQVTVSVTDKDGGVGSLTTTGFIVIYDPSGGFVTGGGWFMSPEGAYAANPTLTGKATFGFVAKYKKGANVPDGNTEFQFKAGDLNFYSTSYDWLVVAGNKAQFKGEGTINGQGSYKFKIWADDDNPDTFRIRIWDDTGTITIYDNGSQQPLGGGSIVVHNK
ncbi:MAG: hypothetical protein WBF37_01935 [Dehalococcoidia bacterium]